MPRQPQILLNAFHMNSVGHINHGLWTHPRDRSTEYGTLEYWTDLARTLDAAGELPVPSRGRVSRRVKSFPIRPRISLLPDDKAQRWLLNISASDRAGLLYSVARVLARHNLHLQLAKVTTLGERVEDTFLISGPELQGQRAQLAIETELLEALSE